MADMSGLAEIENYLRLSERLHTAGQPTAEQLRRLATERIEGVINLALPTSDNAVDEEAVIISGQGLSYFHIPVNWDTPTAQDFDLFARIFTVLQDRCLLVHCAKNMRVSAFIYLYRVTRQHIDHRSACRDLNRIWEPFDQWYRLLNAIRAEHGLAAVDFCD